MRALQVLDAETQLVAWFEVLGAHRQFLRPYWGLGPAGIASFAHMMSSSDVLSLVKQGRMEVSYFWVPQLVILSWLNKNTANFIESPPYLFLTIAQAKCLRMIDLPA